MSAMLTLPVQVHSGAALIASPSSSIREQLLNRLNGRCRPVQQVIGGADALANLEKGNWQVLFLDRRLPDLDADELNDIIRKRFPSIQVVLLDSECSDSEGVGEPEPDQFPVKLSNTFKTAFKAPKPAETSALPGMIGTSEAMQRVYQLVKLVASRPTTVLIVGPTGTGKELVARALHRLSPRAAKPFVVINCAAIPEALLESELFGFTRGAFTGAVQSQIGKISAANGGTLFLDEIGELPLGMQAKLLRFLEQKEVQRLGSCDVQRVDVRVIAATNVDLIERVSRREFRPDLYYRLSAFPVELPPLSKRQGDIIPLAEHFLACMASALDLAAPRLTQSAIHLLNAHAWNGNVRELQHVMERASILAGDGEIIDSSHLYFANSFGSGSTKVSAQP